jgi:hypothetical protein
MRAATGLPRRSVSIGVPGSANAESARPMPIAFSSAGDDADLATVAHQLVPLTRDAAAFDLETDQSLVRDPIQVPGKWS